MVCLFGAKTGWLVTVANVGDSAVYMHTEQGSSRITADHRLDNSMEEVKRLESRESQRPVPRLRTCGFHCLPSHNSGLPPTPPPPSLDVAEGYRVARLAQDLKGPAREGEKGIGPLRAWPGGLMMARALGDSDSGIAVLPYPHIAQIRVPLAGTRIVAASDGLWDSKVAQGRWNAITFRWGQRTRSRL